MAQGSRKDAASLWPAGVALAVTVALAVLLVFLSRSVNRPPVIVEIEVQPPTVAAGASASVRVTAEDPDGDSMRFEYKAETGQIAANSTHTSVARYSPAANGPIADRITVTVTDARGLSSSMQSAIAIQAGQPAATLPPTPAEASSPPIPPAPPAETTTPSPAPPSPVKAIPARTLPPAPTPKQNRPPVLDGGFTVNGIGNSTVRLMATGHDPDDDPITYEWELGGCFEIVTQTQHEAEVKFAEGCTGGDVELRWTDSHEASATTKWSIRQ